MNLPYSYIFRDSGGVGDSKISGCGLSKAYIRYLITLASSPIYNWYANGERVTLSDNELQLIERGDARLAEIALNGSDMISVVEIAFDGIEIPQTFQTINADTMGDIIALTPGNVDWIERHYFGETFLLTADGVYVVDVVCNASNADQAVIRIQTDDQVSPIIAQQQGADRFGPNIRMTASGIVVVNGSSVQLWLRHVSSQAGAEWSLGKMRVTRLGEHGG